MTLSRVSPAKAPKLDKPEDCKAVLIVRRLIGPDRQKYYIELPGFVQRPHRVMLRRGLCELAL